MAGQAQATVALDDSLELFGASIKLIGSSPSAIRWERMSLGHRQAAVLHEQARSEAIACPARGGGRMQAARSAWNNSQRKTGERASARGGQDESGLPSPAALICYAMLSCACA